MAAVSLGFKVCFKVRFKQNLFRGGPCIGETVPAYFLEEGCDMARYRGISIDAEDHSCSASFNSHVLMRGQETWVRHGERLPYVVMQWRRLPNNDVEFAQPRKPRKGDRVRTISGAPDTSGTTGSQWSLRANEWAEVWQVDDTGDFTLGKTQSSAREVKVVKDYVCMKLVVDLMPLINERLGDLIDEGDIEFVQSGTDILKPGEIATAKCIPASDKYKVLVKRVKADGGGYVELNGWRALRARDCSSERRVSLQDVLGCQLHGSLVVDGVQSVSEGPPGAKWVRAVDRVPVAAHEADHYFCVPKEGAEFKVRFEDTRHGWGPHMHSSGSRYARAFEFLDGSACAKDDDDEGPQGVLSRLGRLSYREKRINRVLDMVLLPAFFGVNLAHAATLAEGQCGADFASVSWELELTLAVCDLWEVWALFSCMSLFSLVKELKNKHDVRATRRRQNCGGGLIGVQRAVDTCKTALVSPERVEVGPVGQLVALESPNEFWDVPQARRADWQQCYVLHLPESTEANGVIVEGGHTPAGVTAYVTKCTVEARESADSEWREVEVVRTEGGVTRVKKMFQSRKVSSLRIRPTDWFNHVYMKVTVASSQPSSSTAKWKRILAISKEKRERDRAHRIKTSMDQKHEQVRKSDKKIGEWAEYAVLLFLGVTVADAAFNLLLNGVMPWFWPSLCPRLQGQCVGARYPSVAADNACAAGVGLCSSRQCEAFYQQHVTAYLVVLLQVLNMAAIAAVFGYEHMFAEDLKSLDATWKFWGVKIVVSAGFFLQVALGLVLHLDEEDYFTWYVRLVVTLELPALVALHTLTAYKSDFESNRGILEMQKMELTEYEEQDLRCVAEAAVGPDAHDPHVQVKRILGIDLKGNTVRAVVDRRREGCLAPYVRGVTEGCTLRSINTECIDPVAPLFIDLLQEGDKVGGALATLLGRYRATPWVYGGAPVYVGGDSVGGLVSNAMFRHPEHGWVVAPSMQSAGGGSAGSFVEPAKPTEFSAPTLPAATGRRRSGTVQVTPTPSAPRDGVVQVWMVEGRAPSVGQVSHGAQLPHLVAHWRCGSLATEDWPRGATICARVPEVCPDCGFLHGRRKQRSHAGTCQHKTMFDFAKAKLLCQPDVINCPTCRGRGTEQSDLWRADDPTALEYLQFVHRDLDVSRTPDSLPPAYMKTEETLLEDVYRCMRTCNEVNSAVFDPAGRGMAADRLARRHRRQDAKSERVWRYCKVVLALMLLLLLAKSSLSWWPQQGTTVRKPAVNTFDCPAIDHVLGNEHVDPRRRRQLEDHLVGTVNDSRAQRSSPLVLCSRVGFQCAMGYSPDPVALSPTHLSCSELYPCHQHEALFETHHVETTLNGSGVVFAAPGMDAGTAGRLPSTPDGHEPLIVERVELASAADAVGVLGGMELMSVDDVSVYWHSAVHKQALFESGHVAVFEDRRIYAFCLAAGDYQVHGSCTPCPCGPDDPDCTAASTDPACVHWYEQNPGIQLPTAPTKTHNITPCLLPPPPKHASPARAVGVFYRGGPPVSFSCNFGFAGQPTARCLSDGSIKRNGSCSSVSDCGKLPALSNAQPVSGDDASDWFTSMPNSSGAGLVTDDTGAGLLHVVPYRCDPGYRGRPMVECSGNGEWVVHDDCTAESTSSNCECRKQWRVCGWWGSGCVEVQGCPTVDEQAALGFTDAWCQTESNTCGFTYDTFYHWDYCTPSVRPAEELRPVPSMSWSEWLRQARWTVLLVLLVVLGGAATAWRKYRRGAGRGSVVAPTPSSPQETEISVDSEEEKHDD
eukprot:TRINITY_DN4639_c0_g1_i3.p1 TRINITY_DN4639_c0_g1~~TRINITY_DN4639_c0_g1_i3.p1  ORF type:complete len:2059 (+),score=575.43 TRINITY_DN4639_c0_g1_i3:868-6177(+)